MEDINIENQVERDWIEWLVDLAKVYRKITLRGDICWHFHDVKKITTEFEGRDTPNRKGVERERHIKKKE